MAIFHCQIKIISRGKGKTATAAAAYRSGTKIVDDELGKTHDYTRKGGVAFSEILLCVNAPSKYSDRQTLWNEVQKIEKQKNAQLCREVEVALPIEFSRNEQIEVVREYIKKNFTDKGMIADWSLHDKSDGNPH
ncbi:MAG: MobA/MobL family protein, partial [Lachnospiraceae bacterium]|nr:MobA/MobL family protein [Lachnospiraceae bacterium]